MGRLGVCGTGGRAVRHGTGPSTPSLRFVAQDRPFDSLCSLRTGPSTRSEDLLAQHIRLAAVGGEPNGAEGARTPDLLIANQPLSQLSYGPRVIGKYSISARGEKGIPLPSPKAAAPGPRPRGRLSICAIREIRGPANPPPAPASANLCHPRNPWTLRSPRRRGRPGNREAGLPHGGRPRRSPPPS